LAYTEEEDSRLSVKNMGIGLRLNLKSKKLIAGKFTAKNIFHKHFGVNIFSKISSFLAGIRGIP